MLLPWPSPRSRALVLLLGCLLSALLSAAEKPRLVLLPPQLNQADMPLADAYSSALEQGLQERYQVLAGPAVQVELEKQYAKLDCNPHSCIQNMARALSAELIGDASATTVADGYLLKLTVRNVMLDKVIEKRIYPCRQCDALAAMEALTKMARTQQTLKSGSPAVLLFDSQPSGAQVRINGHAMGKTPYQGFNHQIGESLQVELSLTHYRPLVFEVTLDSELKRLNKALQLQRGKGRLTVTSKPYRAGLSLEINGRVRGALPQDLVIAAGTHTLRVLQGSQLLAQYNNQAVRDSEHTRLQLPLGSLKPFPLAPPAQSTRESIHFPGGTLKMVTIPAGAFQMGNHAGQAMEKPVHQVRLNTFKLSETETTFTQWDACVSAGGCRHRPADQGWGRGERPVIFVSYQDIVEQYIPWLNQSTGLRFRLPSEAEWEYAAKAQTTTNFSWGNHISCSKAQYFGTQDEPCNYPEIDDSWRGTSQVASFNTNAFGLFDMHGNVAEWTQDCWNQAYLGLGRQQKMAPNDGVAWQAGDCRKRVMRGGSWGHTQSMLRSSARDHYSASGRFALAGFRLALD